jgi:hypothetical protein
MAVASTACQATLRVGVDAHRDGRGLVTVTVVLDRDAAKSIPDLAQELRTSDLHQKGWRIIGPQPATNQGVVVQATKPFASPAQAIEVLGELSGDTPGHGPGPFNGFRIDQHHGWLTTTTTFHGVVDLTCGLRCFGDARLQQQLGGQNLGVDPTALQQQAGIILNRIFRFEVAVRLPGTRQTSTSPAPAGNGAVWQPRLGDNVELTATSLTWDSFRVVVLGAAVVALAGAVVAVGRLRRRARPAGPAGPARPA